MSHPLDHLVDDRLLRRFRAAIGDSTLSDEALRRLLVDQLAIACFAARAAPPKTFSPRQNLSDIARLFFRTGDRALPVPGIWCEKLKSTFDIEAEWLRFDRAAGLLKIWNRRSFTQKPSDIDLHAEPDAQIIRMLKAALSGAYNRATLAPDEAIAQLTPRGLLRSGLAWIGFDPVLLHTRFTPTIEHPLQEAINVGASPFSKTAVPFDGVRMLFGGLSGDVPSWRFFYSPAREKDDPARGYLTITDGCTLAILTAPAAP